MEDKIILSATILCDIFNKSKPITKKQKYITINGMVIIYTEFEIDTNFHIRFSVEIKGKFYTTNIIPIENVIEIE